MPMFDNPADAKAELRRQYQSFGTEMADKTFAAEPDPGTAFAAGQQGVAQLAAEIRHLCETNGFDTPETLLVMEARLRLGFFCRAAELLDERP